MCAAVRGALSWHRAVRAHLRDDNARAAALLDGIENRLRGASRVKAVLFRAKAQHAASRYAEAAEDYRQVLARLNVAGKRIAPDDAAYLRLYASIYAATAAGLAEGRCTKPAAEALSALRRVRPSRGVEEMFPPPEETVEGHGR